MSGRCVAGDFVRCYTWSAICAGLRFFFFNDTAPTEIYTLSLHDALPISRLPRASGWRSTPRRSSSTRPTGRSEEHTSELQSRVDLVCRLLLEKKKQVATENHKLAIQQEERSSVQELLTPQQDRCAEHDDE